MIGEELRAAIDAAIAASEHAKAKVKAVELKVLGLTATNTRGERFKIEEAYFGLSEIWVRGPRLRSDGSPGTRREFGILDNLKDLK